MSTPQTPPPEPTKHYVIVMTAAVIAVDAVNPMDAALQARAAAPQVLEASELAWYVRYVSDKPIEVSDEDPGETGMPKIIS